MTRPYETAALQRTGADKKPAQNMANYLRKRLAEETRKNPLCCGLNYTNGLVKFKYAKAAPAPRTGAKYRILGDGKGNFNINKARAFFNRKES